MKSKLIAGSLILAVLVAVLAIITGRQLQQHANDIQVAAVLPLTGVAAEMGQECRRGEELAVEYFNGRPENHRKLNVVFEDSKSLASEGTKAVHSLQARGHRYFVVMLSTVGMAVRPLFIENNSLAFLDATHPGLTASPHPLIFRHSHTSTNEVDLIVPAATEQRATKKLVVYYLNDEYGRTFIELLRGHPRLNIDWSGHPYETTTTDFRSIVQSSGLSKTDGAVALTLGVGRPLGLLMKTIREEGFEGRIYASIGYAVTGARGVLGNNRTGITFTDIIWRDTEATKWMVREYKSRYGREAPVAAILEFQTMLLLATSIRSAKNPEDPVSVAEMVHELAPELVGAETSSNNDIVPLLLLRNEDGL